MSKKREAKPGGLSPQSAQSEAGALEGVRVLDLTTEMGVYSTKLLADLGADVIRIESPSGDSLRRKGPFVGDEPEGEKSLFFIHFNTNKKSVTLNIETSDGAEIFKELVRKADVVVESFAPGYMAGLGLDYQSLRQLNPRLVLVSITAFGQTGPFNYFKGSDIVGVSMGGLTYLGGFSDSAPNYPPAYQGYHLVSSDAVIATIAALFERELTGEGQYIDVSMEESVTLGIEYGMVLYAAQKRVRKRSGRQVYQGWNELFTCKDGYVMCSPLGGSGWREILKWMKEEGRAADLGDERYALVFEVMGDRQMDRGVSAAKKDPRLLKEYPEEIAHIEEIWGSFLMAHTKEELYSECQNRGVRLMPLYTAKDIVEDPQLNNRDFFTNIDYPELGMRLKDIGAPYRLSQTPAKRGKAPRVGEHNLQVYSGELNFSREKIIGLRERGII